VLPGHKFQSHPGVPPGRLIEVLGDSQAAVIGPDSFVEPNPVTAHTAGGAPLVVGGSNAPAQPVQAEPGIYASYAEQRDWFGMMKLYRKCFSALPAGNPSLITSSVDNQLVSTVWAS
jgi:hypothetical protein